MSRVGSKEKIKQFLLANIDRVVESRELHAASGGAGQYGRRVRDLRAEGWPILTHNDDARLKPGQYLLLDKTPPPPKFVGDISARLRAQVLDRNGFTCQMCGLGSGEIDPVTGRKVRLHIGHIKDKNLGGKPEFSNLRALCSTCNQGAKNVTTEKPTTIWLLSQIRRAGQDEQRSVFEFLRKKFSK